MEYWNEGFSQRRQARLVLAAVAAWSLAAHGYCYFNLFYSHDSLLVYQNDVYWQISLGRFLHPVYFRLRGNFYAPALVGALSILFLAGAVFLMVRLLELKSRTLTVLLCGVLASSATVTLTNATYLHDADIYMLALLLAAAGVYACARLPWGVPLGGAVLCLSLGLYQAYFQTAVFLCMLLVAKKILEGSSVREILTAGLRYVAALLLGLALYYTALKGALALQNVSLIDAYNGLTGVGQFGGLGEMVRLAAKTYWFTIRYFLSPLTYHSGLMGGLNVLLLLLSLGMLGFLAWVRKIRGWNLALLVLLVLLMPFGINVIYFISKGVEHHLMVFSFFLVYLFAAVLLEGVLKETGAAGRLGRLCRGAVCLGLAALILNSVIYANQVYLRKDLEYQTTLSVMTRIVDRMEQTEGYVPGETPVVFAGTLEDSPVLGRRMGLDDLLGTGLWYHLSVSYYSSYSWYLKGILAYPVQVLDSVQAAQWAGRPEVQAMTPFPGQGCCQVMEGVLVVKLSETGG